MISSEALGELTAVSQSTKVPGYVARRDSADACRDGLPALVCVSACSPDAWLTVSPGFAGSQSSWSVAWHQMHEVWGEGKWNFTCGTYNPERCKLSSKRNNVEQCTGEVWGKMAAHEEEYYSGRAQQQWLLSSGRPGCSLDWKMKLLTKFVHDGWRKVIGWETLKKTSFCMYCMHGGQWRACLSWCHEDHRGTLWLVKLASNGNSNRLMNENPSLMIFHICLIFHYKLHELRL